MGAATHSAIRSSVTASASPGSANAVAAAPNTAARREFVGDSFMTVTARRAGANSRTPASGCVKPAIATTIAIGASIVASRIVSVGRDTVDRQMCGRANLPHHYGTATLR